MSSRSQPNVVFIVGDNVGWGDVRPVAMRLGALAQSAAKYPHITPGEEFAGYT